METISATTKSVLLAKAQETLREQIKDIQNQLSELQKSAEAEEKSSAGDKFETHQEMLHQSRDILEKQLINTQNLLGQINAVPVKELKSVQEGALVKLPIGYVWVSVPMGKLELDSQDFQLVSKDSPLITALWDLKQGESGEFRGKKITVESLY
jgi:hypothetical protein